MSEDERPNMILVKTAVIDYLENAEPTYRLVGYTSIVVILGRNNRGAVLHVEVPPVLDRQALERLGSCLNESQTTSTLSEPESLTDFAQSLRPLSEHHPRRQRTCL